MGKNKIRSKSQRDILSVNMTEGRVDGSPAISQKQERLVISGICLESVNINLMSIFATGIYLPNIRGIKFHIISSVQEKVCMMVTH